MNTIHPHLMVHLAALAASAATTFALLSGVVSLAEPRASARSTGFATRGAELGRTAGAASPRAATEITALAAGTGPDEQSNQQ